MIRKMTCAAIAGGASSLLVFTVFKPCYGQCDLYCIKGWRHG